MVSSCRCKRKEVTYEKKKELDSLLGNTAVNLSDFALFLSVMKNREAYENTLSIILDEDDLELTQVRVEEVVLNVSGKRAIRLDAWAQDSRDRQFNMEMQNDTETDDVKKRARFYQGLIDSPVLKSGKKTRYKHLPSTVIIFITQEDIFQRNQAIYTFTERCMEIPDLLLGDGTKKIFLNMSSRQGRPELISLLQYMKDSRIDNPEIVVKDARIQKLDKIVQEVKQSEEWEAANMSIAKMAMEKGEEIGKEIGEKITLIKFITRKLQKGKEPEEIAEELDEELNLVTEICAVASVYAPDYDVELIYREWISRKKTE